MRLGKFLWILPFLGFGIGYIVTLSFFHTKEVQAPNFVGKSVRYAVGEASKLGLNIHLLREKVDPDLDEGTVLEQIPKASEAVKPNQYIFVTLSKHPKGIVTPRMLTEKQADIVKQCRDMGIRSRIYWLPSRYPKDRCMAQFPPPGETLNNRPLITYLSSGKDQFIVFPDLRKKPVTRVKEFLEDEGIKVDIVCDPGVRDSAVLGTHAYAECTVVDQNPMAGSIIDKGKRLYVQLQVSP